MHKTDCFAVILFVARYFIIFLRNAADICISIMLYGCRMYTISRLIVFKTIDNIVVKTLGVTFAVYKFFLKISKPLHRYEKQSLY